MAVARRTSTSPVLDEKTGAFVRALASDSRQRIMALFADGACLTVNEITQQCGLSQPATSEQLAIMRKAGLVTATRSGNHVHYRANATTIAARLTSLQALLVPGPAAASADPTDLDRPAGHTIATPPGTNGSDPDAAVQVNGFAEGSSDSVAPVRKAGGPPILDRASLGFNWATGDPAPAKEVLRDVIPDGNGPGLTADQIMEAASEYYGVSIDYLRGHRRFRAHVNARQVSMYLCRELTQLSLPQIGRAFGGRDHSTVMYAHRKIRQQIAESGTSFRQIIELTNIIKARLAIR